MNRSRRLAIVSDYLEEGWPSMQLAADMLTGSLVHQRGWDDVRQLRPPLKRRFSAAAAAGGDRLRFNADRLCGRMADYPLFLLRRRRHFDAFHVADHSYAHLVHALPRSCTGVYCHDLDTFRCLLQPEREPRPRWFRAMARLIESGLRRAAVVFHNSRAVGRELQSYGLVRAERLVHAPLGVSTTFQPVPAEARAAVPAWLPANYLLHVGSCIARKRIDVLLSVFEGLRTRFPDLLLVKVGGDWTAAQLEQIERLDLRRSLVHHRQLTEADLVTAYQFARATLVTSGAEGFCLPLIESLACGGLAVASDLPVLREVAGDAAIYCGLAEVPEWIARITALLRQEAAPPPLELRLRQARRYSWASHAETISNAYQCLIEAKYKEHHQ